MDRMTVYDLKRILENQPDDRIIIFPVVDEDDYKMCYGFRLARSAALLKQSWPDIRGNVQENFALCINVAIEEDELNTQLESHDGVKAIETWF